LKCCLVDSGHVRTLPALLGFNSSPSPAIAGREAPRSGAMPAPGGGGVGTDVLDLVEPQSLKKLSLKSLKRALDIFAPEHGDRVATLSERFVFFPFPCGDSSMSLLV
jgi:hypothetical protein